MNKNTIVEYEGNTGGIRWKKRHGDVSLRDFSQSMHPDTDLYPEAWLCCVFNPIWSSSFELGLTYEVGREISVVGYKDQNIVVNSRCLLESDNLSILKRPSISYCANTILGMSGSQVFQDSRVIGLHRGTEKVIQSSDTDNNDFRWYLVYLSSGI